MRPNKRDHNVFDATNTERIHAVVSSLHAALRCVGGTMQTLIISSDVNRGNTHTDTVVVRTPLDAIARLERPRSIDAVVLAGSFAVNEELATFLAESYPSVRLLRDER